MAWIKEISRKENKKLNDIYESAESRTKEETANVLKVHSIHPEALEAHMALYEELMFGKGELSRQQREMIGVVVSSANKCPYCVGHHGASLVKVTKNKALMEKVSENYLEANLTKADLEICKYAEKLTKTSYKMIEADIEKLRKVGFSDKAIFDINQITAYFNYVNRVVDGLGVELE